MDIASVVRILVILLLVALVVILLARRIAVPYTLGLVIVGLLLSIINKLFHLLPNLQLIPSLVLFVFLPAFLFEGAWSISVAQLRKNWLHVFLLVVPALLLEVVLIAIPLYYLTALSWGTSFLLAAILSPTDPVAVLSLFRQLKVNEELSTIIEGESLFNDGVAGVLYQVFLIVVVAAATGQPLSAGQAWLDGLGTFLLQAGGGTALGLLGGYAVSRLVSFIDEPLIETTITIVTAYGIYLLADELHTSGILAVIFAALIIGSYGRRVGMEEPTREAVNNFWSVVAFVANALLFLLVGIQLNAFEFLSSSQALSLLLTAGLVVAAVLLSRLLVVLTLPTLTQPLIPRTLWSFVPRSWRVVIFWSGLRGALSIAFVLALPLNVPLRDTLIFATYAVVLFTLLVQGFSLRWILKRLPSVT